MTNWFEVDKEGLARLMERRGKGFVLAELLQNAWDAPGATAVHVRTAAVPGRPLVELSIEDNSPTGFTRLEHAFTLFAESEKKADPTLRGRFALGEKLVLSLCDAATIATTKGTVTFDADGRRIDRRRARDAGSVVSLRMRMTRDELDAMRIQAHSFLPPMPTWLDGERLAQRPILREFEATLPTEWADAGGVLRRTPRKTTVRLYAPSPGESGRLYELGIPVCDTGDRFDIEILQKVPVTMERDAVSQPYLRQVRAAALNHAADLLSAEQAAESWVIDALGHRDVASETVRQVLTARFGDKVVIADPSDREASHRAVSEGYTVIHGGTFSAQQWAQIRDADALKPAGQVFPTRHHIAGTGTQDAAPVSETEAMSAFKARIEHFASRLVEAPVAVRFANEFLQPFTAWYGQRTITYNVARLGRRWFDGPLNADHLDLTIHELGHEYEANHLDKRFNDALTRLAGRAVMLALQEPELFAAPSPSLDDDLAGPSP